MPSTNGAPISDNHLRLLRLLEVRPELSQRELSRELGMSLGKVNYCLNALVDKGLVKVSNFRNNESKLSYAYLLTPRGMRSKAVLTAQFLQLKLAEYEALKVEIAELTREIRKCGVDAVVSVPAAAREVHVPDNVA
jgi:EPS-associated MarR family transcriptional regulator